MTISLPRAALGNPSDQRGPHGGLTLYIALPRASLGNARLLFRELLSEKLWHNSRSPRRPCFREVLSVVYRFPSVALGNLSHPFCCQAISFLIPADKNNYSAI